MKKLISKTWFIVVIVIAVPLAAFETVHWLENKYEVLPVLNKATNLMNNDYHFQNQKNHRCL